MSRQLVRFDTAALNKALVGFDRMFDELDRLHIAGHGDNYPPHNIMKTGELTYAIEIAVSGFAKDEISVELEGNRLTVKGESRTPNESADIVYLHRGLAKRNIHKEFPLAEHIKVKGAEIENGILTIKLELEVPEEKKPRLIDIIEIK